MSAIAIRVEGLGKMYRIGAAQERYVALRDVLSSQVRRIGRRIFRRHSSAVPAFSDFWALRDVSFDVPRGECVGIIGRNGAGKSTLLKVLSRITEPTTGGFRCRGRIASLLEVGTGFHPELTGRENIYLNGAILGMQRAEIRRKFDEIVAFSEVEKFLDTPVKYYSSGMYTRLAFSVAAHLEPEILVVDEVLAVGDAEFQRKCLGKMESIAHGGRTVLFVSHNVTAVRRLCSRGVVLRHGRIICHADIDAAVEAYLGEFAGERHPDLAARTQRGGNGQVRIVGFEALSDTGAPLAALRSGDKVTFRLTCRTEQGAQFDNVVASVGIGEPGGAYLLLLRSNFGAQALTVRDDTHIDCTVNDLPLADGVYSVTLFLAHHDHEVLDSVSDAARFVVEGGDFFGTGSRGLPGVCRTLTRADWTTK